MAKETGWIAWQRQCRTMQVNAEQNQQQRLPALLLGELQQCDAVSCLWECVSGSAPVTEKQQWQSGISAFQQSQQVAMGAGKLHQCSFTQQQLLRTETTGAEAGQDH